MSIPGRIYNAATAASIRSLAEPCEREGVVRLSWLGEESDGGGVLVYDDLRGWVDPTGTQEIPYSVLRRDDGQEEE